VTDGSFCARLRRERERRQIALSSISANTKIRVGLFESLERGDVSRWPAGIYRRAIIRAYAAGIGLDPDATTQEFLEVFPDPDHVPAAPNGGPAAAAASRAQAPAPAPGVAVLRLTLADARSPFSPGQLLLNMRDRFAAVAIDAGVVAAIAVSVFVACGAFWLPLAVVMTTYYVGGILLLGNSPGVCLRAPANRRPGKTSVVTTMKSRIAKSLVASFAGVKQSVSVPTTPEALRPDGGRARSRSPA
jgi:hypothetical protein